MPSNQQQALFNCNCNCSDGQCNGCCFPLDGDGNQIDIPYEISAPSCPELDGFSDSFYPLAPSDPGTRPDLPCGICGYYKGYLDTPTNASGSIYTVDGAFQNPPGCVLFTPPFSCGWGPWHFALACLNADQSGDADDPTQPSCCKRLRLYWKLKDVAGDDFDITRVIYPLSCSCEGGMTAIFPLVDLFTLVPNPGDLCPLENCYPYNGCSLADATLVI